MTSTPVSASTKVPFVGSPTAGVQAGNDVTNTFSNMLKSQKSDVKASKPEGATRTQVKGRNDRVSEKEISDSGNDNEKLSPEEEAEQAEKAAEAAAGIMLVQTAETLGITEEEVQDLLTGLDMSEMDLLNPEGLKAVVLEAAGETDACSFMTNEELMADLKELQGSLTEVTAQVSEMTGLDATEVEALFENAGMQEVQAALSEAVAEPEIPVDAKAEPEPVEESSEVHTEQSFVKSSSTEEDGAEIMLERSLAAKESDRGEEKPLSGETPQNPFMQNVQVHTAQEMVQTSEAAVSFEPDTALIMNQITDYMKAQVSEGMSELEMQLHPESLGNLHVRLIAKEGMLTAQFTAQNDAVKATLESQMIQLQETFEEQGVKVEAIEVMVASHKFDRNLSQNSGQQEGASDRQPAKAKVRRLNLNDEAIAEESLDAEEQLAAEMMRQNGGTVDYMA
ncbi:MAG: flagellar hook-length control protein FliK [Lachnospiraceae bacterium]|nr:flagellar hook-length control protein FliK [Lachnospiraceae bacterium]